MFCSQQSSTKAQRRCSASKLPRIFDDISVRSRFMSFLLRRTISLANAIFYFIFKCKSYLIFSPLPAMQDSDGSEGVDEFSGTAVV